MLHYGYKAVESLFLRILKKIILKACGTNDNSLHQQPKIQGNNDLSKLTNLSVGHWA